MWTFLVDPGDLLMMKETIFGKMYEESRALMVSLKLHFLIICFSLWWQEGLGLQQRLDKTLR